MGIPVVQVTTIVDIPQMVGVSRILRAVRLTSPCSNPDLPSEQEKIQRRQLAVKALALLEEEGRKKHFDKFD